MDLKMDKDIKSKGMNENSNLTNAAESSIIGVVTSFVLNEVLPWAIHTIGALISGIIVATALFFFNRYLKRRFK